MFGLRFDNCSLYKMGSMVKQYWRVLYVDEYIQLLKFVLYLFSLLDKLPVLLYKYVFISVNYIIKNIELRFDNVYISNLTDDYLG